MSELINLRALLKQKTIGITNKIANQVLDEVASLSVEEVEERMNRRECIGAIINRLVGEEIMPAILPPIEEK